MKLRQINITALLALSGLVALAPLSQAQDKKEEQPQIKPAAPVPPAAKPDATALILLERVKRMATELKLSDEQKEKLKPIIEEELAKFKTFRDDQSLEQAARVAKYREIREGTQVKIKALLTPEQAEQYNKARTRPAKLPAVPTAPAPGQPAPAPAPKP